MPKEIISFDEKVRPVLESRCVVCHGCYDAPCQLKLSSPEGIHRGANKKKVYNASRFTADAPTRLFIDAMTTEEWRQKGFKTVLNEGEVNKVRNLEEAVKDADIISESVPEDIEVKKNFYKELAKVAPERTIFTTNSSTTLPSEYAEETGRPGKFVALHFANGIWDANVGEVMGHAGTDAKTFDRVVEFARQIGMVPIPIHKEQNGYVLNSLLVPLLSAAGNLMFNGVADVESIDKTWMISTGVKMGPFGVMDMVGMKTMYDIDKLWGEKLGDEAMLARAGMIKEKYIDKGKMGISTGEGFYKYPNPAYEYPDFLK